MEVLVARAPPRVLCSAISVALLVSGASAQGDPNQLGGQDRADAASRMIVLAVQQAVSALPPTSGQALTYTYDPSTLTFVSSDELGPTAFTSAHTIEAGTIVVRAATSYFEMSESFGPITYHLQSNDLRQSGFGKLGLHAEARVGLLNLSASYGLVPRVEVSINVPVSIVDARAAQTFTTATSQLGVPAREAPWTLAETRDGLAALLRTGFLSIREETFGALGFQFDSGTRVGVGRIAVAGKGVLWADQRLWVAVAPQLAMPSPNEAEFSGPGSAALFPRVVAQWTLAPFLDALIDVGYEYDFQTSELSRFAWSIGATVPGRWYSIDAGFSGSQYDTGIRWTPTLARGVEADGSPFTIRAIENNELGTTLVDLAVGGKIRLSDRVAVSGVATVPVTDDGFRPEAMGTLAIEVAF